MRCKQPSRPHVMMLMCMCAYMQIVNGTAYNKYMVERFWLGALPHAALQDLFVTLS